MPLSARSALISPAPFITSTSRTAWRVRATGFFSATDGAVLQGPPQRALPRVALLMKGGQLVATGIRGESA